MNDEQGAESRSPRPGESERPRAKKGFSPYMLLPVALLSLTVLAQVVLIMSATGDPSHVVEDDYYQKAVHWDDKMAQDQANAKLGWKLEVNTTASEKGVELEVKVLGKDEQPIRGARIDVETFHNARANHRVKKTLVAAGDVYTGVLPLQRPGLYELRFNVAQGADVFTHVERRDLTPALKGVR